MNDELLHGKDALLNGKIVWYELLTTDLAAAEAFYRAVVGWTITPFEGAPPDEPYHQFSNAEGRRIAAAMPIPPQMTTVPPHWKMYIGVPDIEAAAADVQRHGGTALMPKPEEVPGVGSLRVMQDPQGAVFALFQPLSAERRPDAEPGIGDVAWHELSSTDGDAAARFYQHVFGWRELEAFDMGPMGTYHIFGRTTRLGGIMTKPAAMASVPSHWGLYFRVASADAGAERVKAHGGTVLNGPMEVPGGNRIVQCRDPQGAAFALHEVKSA